MPDSFKKIKGKVLKSGEFEFEVYQLDPSVDLGDVEKLYSAGAFWGVWSRFNNSRIIGVDHYLDLFDYDIKIDLFFIGSLKTLFPDLKLGGDFRLFDVLVVVKDQKKLIFPILFYFGPSGTSIGGWHEKQPIVIKNFFKEQLENYTPVSAFEIPIEKFRDIFNNFEISLRKIPITDFEAQYNDDIGKFLVGIKDGVPYIKNKFYEHEIQGHKKEVSANSNEKSIRTSNTVNREVSALQVSPSGKYIVIGYNDGKLQIINFYSGNIIRSIKKHIERITHIIFTSDERFMITNSREGIVIIWDFINFNLLIKLESNKKGWIFSSLILDEEKHQIIAGLLFEDKDKEIYGNRIEIWDYLKGKLVKEIQHSNRFFDIISLVPNSNLLIGILNIENIGIFDMDKTLFVKNFKADYNAVNAIAISPNGHHLITSGDDMNTHLWDLEKFSKISSFELNSKQILITKNSKSALLLTHGMIRELLISVLEIKLPNEIIKEPIKYIKLTPKEDFLVSVSIKNNIIITDYPNFRDNKEINI